jgi:hypothetical protein
MPDLFAPDTLCRPTDTGEHAPLYPYEWLTISRCYPCRCLCFGVREQITRITPLRLITLQYSQRGFTDARTFIVASFAAADAAVLRRAPYL